MKSIALAYCIDNIKIAEEIERQLSRASYSFEHIYCKRTTNEEALSAQLRAKVGPILLIISDNFLKSAQCMSGGLKLLQERGGDILPIIVEGQQRDEQGNLSSVTTQFDRVSDIIKYINYWQDQYLDLRKQKRQLQDELDEEAFNEHLRVMRDVSGEVGEFLRTLRNMNFMTYEEFAANSFEQFFQFTDDDAGWRMFRDLPPLVPPTPMPPQPESKPEPEPEVNLNDIPGMDILKERQADTEEPTPQESQDVQPQEEPTPNPEPTESTTSNSFSFISASESDSDENIGSKEFFQTESSSEPEPEESVEDILVQIDNLLQFENRPEALQVLEKALQSHPNNAELRYRYASLLATKSDGQAAAIEHLEHALEAHPEHEDALYLRGQLAELEEDFLLAKNSYEKVIEQDDENADAYYRLGMVISANFPDQIEQGAKYFKKAAKHDPYNFDALYRYANLLSEELDKPKKAMKYLRKVLKAQPSDPFANYDLAVLYHQQGDQANAREYYLRAVKINPELKTPENDKAFEFKVKAEQFTGEKAITEDTIEALKQSIRQLEDMLHAQEEAAEQPASEKSPLPGEGKTVLLTGATAGIGRATAELLAENGFNLILTGRRQERLDKIEEELEGQYPTSVKTLAFDVRDAKAAGRAFEELDADWQEVDILINNAGKAKGLSPIHEGELEHWEEMIDTNVKGLLYMTRLVAPQMVKRGKGQIINIGSSAGKEVYPKGNVYCATKFAVDALTKSMRLDLHEHNIRVSQISPGHVEETEFARVRFDGDEERAKIYEDFRPLTSHDVAEAILFAITRPPHVNVQDIFMMGTQQANATTINRSGRHVFDEEE